MNYRIHTDAEKKRFINSFVESVEIFEEDQEDGRFLKSIKFRFPVYYNGAETQEVNLSDSRENISDKRTKGNVGF
ncbi:MAG: hypothetical protein IJR96_05640 [Pseudobutyrivibrio sp.]|nr:hypothetical protein [Pseudobutyrivibrio sp.]